MVTFESVKDFVMESVAIATDIYPDAEQMSAMESQAYGCVLYASQIVREENPLLASEIIRAWNEEWSKMFK